MTGEQKISNIEAQIAACKRGHTNVIACPYCSKQNIRGNPLCCDTFARAVAAILLRKDLHAKKEQAERIAEKVSAN